MTTAAAARLLVNDTMSPVEDSIKKLVTKLSNDVYFISRRVCESAHCNFRHRFVVDIVVGVVALIVLLLQSKSKSSFNETYSFLCLNQYFLCFSTNLTIINRLSNTSFIKMAQT